MNLRTLRTSNTSPGIGPGFELMQVSRDVSIQIIQASPPRYQLSRADQDRQHAIFELLRHVGEHFVSGAGDQHIVLDPHTAPSRHINARLDGDNHSRPQLGFLADGQPRRFVNLQTRAVPQAMTKCLAEASSSDDLSRDAVDLLASHTGLESPRSPRAALLTQLHISSVVWAKFYRSR